MAPPELEAVLLSHTQIVDAAVIGVQPFSGDNSEYPRAYVVRRKSDEAESLGSDEVKRFMAERLAKYKRLDGGVVFVDEIVSVGSYSRFTNNVKLTDHKAQKSKWKEPQAHTTRTRHSRTETREANFEAIRSCMHSMLRHQSGCYR